MFRRYGLQTVLLLAVGAIGWCSGQRWSSEALPFVHVTVPALPKPPAPRSQQPLLHKVTTKVVKPRIVATTPEPAHPAPAVLTFCAPVIRDTALVKPTLPPVRLSYAHRTLSVWSYLGDSREYYSEHRTRSPYTAVFRDTTVEVTGPRFGWLRDCAKTALPATAVGAVHSPEGAALGAALGCAVGVLF